MARRRYTTRLSNRVGAIRREIAAAFGMLALVMNLLAGIALSSRPVLAVDPNGRLLINSAFCGTLPGGESDEAPDANLLRHPSAHCLFCLPLLSGTAADAGAGCAGLVRLATALKGSLAAQSFPPAQAASTHFARGPPTI